MTQYLCAHVKWLVETRDMTYMWLIIRLYVYTYTNIYIYVLIYGLGIYNIYGSGIYKSCINTSCRVFQWVISRVWMSHVRSVHESCHECHWVMSLASTSLNESCHTCAGPCHQWSRCKRDIARRRCVCVCVCVCLCACAWERECVCVRVCGRGANMIILGAGMCVLDSYHWCPWVMSFVCQCVMFQGVKITVQTWQCWAQVCVCMCVCMWMCIKCIFPSMKCIFL